MKLFFLIAVMYGEAYEVDSGLTAEDCAAALSNPPNRIEIAHGATWSAADAVFTCEESKDERQRIALR